MAIINKGKVLAYGNPEIFIKELEGCIWTKNIDKGELPLYKAKFVGDSHTTECRKTTCAGVF